jgi:hypothetical protein
MVSLDRPRGVHGHPRFLLRGYVGRGSRDPAAVPDRRSPSFRVCAESANAFEPRAYDERGRPAIGRDGGVVRPAPNTEIAALAEESAQRKRDERNAAAIPTSHHARLALAESCNVVESVPMKHQALPSLERRRQTACRLYNRSVRQLRHETTKELPENPLPESALSRIERPLL